MAILHEDPDDKSLFCQRFMQETLYISLPNGHPLVAQNSVSLNDLKDIRILMDGSVGFWRDICSQKLSEENLLIQNSFDAFSELVEASSLPLFNSDQFIARGYEPQGRTSIPISDPEVHVTYWLCCLASEQNQYRSIFNTVRGNILKSK